MERRYLAATIAMAATFALFSHAFSAGLLTKVQQPRETLVSEVRCAAQSLRAHLLDKVNRSLGSGIAEEAQLRVELNLPSPAFAAAAPAPPARPHAFTAKASAAPAVACPSQRLESEIRLPRDFERAQARAIAMQSKALALQEKMQSKALATQARMMAVQARFTSRETQREITRAALAQARANTAQAKINSHSCSGERTVHVISRSGDDDTDINVDMDQLSRQIEEQVSRSVANSIRNF